MTGRSSSMPRPVVAPSQNEGNYMIKCLFSFHTFVVAPSQNEGNYMLPCGGSSAFLVVAPSQNEGNYMA